MIELQRSHSPFVHQGYQTKSASYAIFFGRASNARTEERATAPTIPSFSGSVAAATDPSAGLKDPVALKAACKQETAFGDWYGIRDTEVIASFNCLGEVTLQFLAERLDLEVQGDALFISRWEADPRNKLHTGYGKQFEDHTVSYAHLPELKRSQSSHIALSYKMGDLKLAVQTEVDAIDCDCHASPCQPGTPAPSPTIRRRLSGGRFDVLSLDTGDSKEAPNHGAYSYTQEGTRILHAGKQFNLSCCVEIKTRMKKPDQKETIDFMEQLYFQRTSKLFLALHNNGSFYPTLMGLCDVADDLKRWEAEQQPLLARLVKLLEELRARAMKAAASAGGQCKMSIGLEITPKFDFTDLQNSQYC
ncbi:unnamed protein product [Parascedosporium putredinis]|uniref:Geranylgeranyl pyrophosphate synthetase n=1 Tax=Parascedosporium putredinis TaxID=1442378 RepID=A0A9P1MC46_9PEZI|nr:unnamed protein product [Parascedosporium putredinis]CAI8000898.1 unnamed protein product [Parascedosporium putredinis]